MTWVRLPDEVASDPDIDQVGFAAFGAYVRCVAYSNMHLLDGVLERLTLRAVLAARKDRLRILTALFDAGWMREEGSTHVTLIKFMEFQPTAAQVLALQAKKRTAGRAGGQASAQARAARAGGESSPAKLVRSSEVEFDDRLLAQARLLGLDAAGARIAYDEMQRKTAGWDARGRDDWERYLVGFFKTMHQRRRDNGDGSAVGVVRVRASRSAGTVEEYETDGRYDQPARDDSA